MKKTARDKINDARSGAEPGRCSRTRRMFEFERPFRNGRVEQFDNDRHSGERRPQRNRCRRDSPRG